MSGRRELAPWLVEGMGHVCQWPWCHGWLRTSLMASLF